MPPETLGERIRRHRERLEWTQEQLSARMQLRGHSTVTRQRIGEIENGQRDVTAGEAISFARVFGVAITALLGVPDLAPD